MEMTKLSDVEFKRVMSEARTTEDPEYIRLEQMVDELGRVYVKGITARQKARLYYAFPGMVHIVKHGDEGFVVYLDHFKANALKPVKD